jgi:protein arginine N-methyltransferase 1
MYSISDYGSMIADGVRMDAYVQALRQAVKPGSVVLDLGTGTGIFAMLACQLGARRVYAIEADDSIQVARETAADNGLAERIEFIQNLSTRVTLPEPVDVIVSDLHGVLPLFQQLISSIADARDRFLAPGGILIPQCETLWAAVVEAPELYSKHVIPWDDNTHALDLRAARRVVTNTWRKGRVDLEQLLVEPECWAKLDYNVVKDPNVSAEMTWTAMREGTAHGLSLWFDTVLAEGVSFSNAPGKTQTIFGNAFFPLSTPVMLAAGDTVSVAVRADLVGEDYIWCWNTRILDQGRSDQVKAQFKQSTFFGALLSPAQLQKRADSHIPKLNEEGQIDQFILSLVDGQTSLEEIARRVSGRFPSRFIKWQDALTRAGELLPKYTR